VRVSPKYLISPLHNSHLHLRVGAVGSSTGWVISASLRDPMGRSGLRLPVSNRQNEQPPI